MFTWNSMILTAVLFAVGAVSGTILSFEMGLLWPGLMERYGDVIGLPFVLVIFLAVHFWRIRKDGGISGPL